MKKYYCSFPNAVIGLVFMIFFLNCNTPKTFTSPEGYNFSKPEKLVMETALREISGICFLERNDEMFFAIEDETGKLYQYHLADGTLTKSKFGKKGDYEDLAIINNQTASVLSSEGSIFIFNISKAGQEKIDSVQEYKNILPAGEYEGLFAADSTLYALCKDCPQDKPSREVSVFALQQSGSSGLSLINSFKVVVSGIQVGDGDKIKVHPSAFAKSPVTNDWFIISSVNKILLQFDERWKLKSHFKLDPSLFNQPEGLAFNSKGDLFISNEGGTGSANILIFRYLSK